MLKMEYFYYMKEVCQTGSINRAAENLYISQPYLSQTLKKIEQQLGVSQQRDFSYRCWKRIFEYLKGNYSAYTTGRIFTQAI